MRKPGTAICTTLAMSLCAPAVCAEVDWHFSGFASLSAGRISEPSLTFIDYEKNWSFDQAAWRSAYAMK